MALEGLYVPTSVPWYAEFKSELLSFPAGKYDDQVDALGLIGQLLDRMVHGSRPSAPPPRILKKPNDYVAPEPVGRIDDWIMWY
jgi:hypothetical protein